MTMRRMKLLLAAGITLSGIFVFTPKVSAAAECGTGYFSANKVCTADPISISRNDVIGPRNAVPSNVYDGVGDDKLNLYNWIFDNAAPLNEYPDTRNEFGAAFIIDTMLGRVPHSKRITQDKKDDLRRRLVDNPNIRIYDVVADPNNYGNGQISFYSDTGDDDFFATYNSGSRHLLIVEDTSTGTRYVIEIPCANPVGGLKLPVYDVRPTVTMNFSCPGTLSGRAGDADKSTRELTLDIYVGGPKGTGTKVTTITTDDHEYSYLLPAAYQPTLVARLYYVYANGVKSDGSPGIIWEVHRSYGPCSTDRAPLITMSLVCPGIINGAASDPDQPARSLAVDIYVGGPIGTGVKVATVWTVSGKYGYTLTGANTPGNVRKTYYAYVNGVTATGADGVDANTNKDLGPCNQASCNEGSSGLPGTMAVGDPQILQPSVTFSNIYDSTMTQTDPKMHYTIRFRPAGLAVWTVVIGHDRDIGYMVGADMLTITTTPINFTPTAKGSYAIEWTITGRGVIPASLVGALSCGSRGETTNVPDQGDAGERPYFTMFGGDIISGGNINAYNRNGAGSYAGAGSNLAVIIGETGVAKNFSTNGGGTGLGFSNTGLSSSVDDKEYAKGFLDLPTEPEVDITGAVSFPGNFTSCVKKCIYIVPAQFQIPAGTVIPAGVDITLYAVSGDVIVLGNITYASYDITNIPRLNVYVPAGNIIIENTATEIHGVFVAHEGGVAGKGFFYTCGINRGAGPGSPVDYTSLQTEIAQCNSSLKVYGAVTADRIVLARTPGHYITGSGAAESFIFTPEVWLHGYTSGSTGTSGAPKFDSYYGLPPVL